MRQGDKRGKLEVLVVAQEGVRRHMVRVKAVGGGGGQEWEGEETPWNRDRRGAGTHGKSWAVGSGTEARERLGTRRKVWGLNRNRTRGEGETRKEVGCLVR